MTSALQTQFRNKWMLQSNSSILLNTQNNMFTFAIPIIHFCAPHLPWHGQKILFLGDRSSSEDGSFFFGGGHWQVWLRVGGGDDRMSCHADGPRWAPVGPSLWAKVWRWSGEEEDGLGIHRSGDKHQWEYERLDANRSGSHATPWRKETTGERLTLCSAFFFFRGGHQDCHWNYWPRQTSIHNLSHRRFWT